MIGDLIRRNIYTVSWIFSPIFCVIEPWIVRHVENAAKRVAFENVCFSNIVKKKLNVVHTILKIIITYLYTH